VLAGAAIPEIDLRGKIYYSGKSRNILFWNRSIENTPQVIAESERLNTGLKKINDCPAFIGDHSGQ
jgi:hypothetical protein